MSALQVPSLPVAELNSCILSSFRNEPAGKFVVDAYPSFQGQLSIAVIPDLTTVSS